MVFVDSESNKTMSILLDVQMAKVLHVVMVNDSNIGISVVDTCFKDADVW